MALILVSVVVKVLPGFENLLLGHSSWYTYAATMRIYKHWDFRVSDPNAATGKMSFSSYPGMEPSQAIDAATSSQRNDLKQFSFQQRS